MPFLLYSNIMSKKQSRERTNKEIDGVISINTRGRGYVSTEVAGDDIEIESRFLGTALNGDQVLVKIKNKTQSGKQRGAVTRVLNRARMQFVGILKKENGRCLLEPDDKKMYADILISKSKSGDFTCEPGIKVLSRITDWKIGSENPEGEILRILGPKGTHEVEMQALVFEHGFNPTFPADVREEAEKIGRNKAIPLHEIQNRRDFRDIPTFTIDPKDAKDFDDALSFRTLENGNAEIGIHIADVSYYVQPGSAIDEEAQTRGTSIYLVDRTIPMLPHVLSDDVCSLNEGEDKLTYSAVFELNKDARIQKRWFGPTIINSNKRFSYKEAQAVLEEKTGPHQEELTALNALAIKLRKRRREAGSISFEHDEVEFKLDKSGKPLEILRKKRLDTMMLIEDFMLLANREVAENFYKLCKRLGLRDLMFVYRIHDMPDIDRIEELSIFLRAIGYEFDTKNERVTAKEINKLFKQIEGKPEEDLIKIATIRSMAKAVYSTKNIGHFGLAFRYYTHFTSPIRRYPDLMVHRIMKSHLNGKPLTKKLLRDYERLTIQSSQREIDAVGAERDSIKYKQVEFMESKIGEEFEGIIVGVVEWGLYVEEQNTLVEGLVPVRTLAGDYYTHDEKHYQLVGQKTKKVYQLGDKVKMKLVSASRENKRIEWVLTE